MDLKEFVAKYCTFEQECFQKLMVLNARSSQYQMQLAQCEMEQSQIWQTILQNKARMDRAKAAAVTKIHKPRSVWTLVR